jgi:phosphohistidine phosphatase
MAEHIVHNAPRPDLILCSTAVRTRQTLAPLIHRLASPAPPIALEKGLYLAPEATLLARLQAVPDAVGTVLLIGHNEGIGELAEDLAGKGPAAAQASLEEKFPTGALAVFQVPAGPWRDLTLGAAELRSFVRPRDLLPE